MRPASLRQAVITEMHIRGIRFDTAPPLLPLLAATSKPMNLLQLISNVFINTMGITKPSPQAERRAAWFIVFMLAAVIAAVAALAAIAIQFASRR